MNFEHQSSDSGGEQISVRIPPTSVYAIDNSTDCKLRSHANMCIEPADACMLACGSAIPMGIRSDVDDSVLEDVNSDAFVNFGLLPVSRWRSLKKHLGLCLRGYVEFSQTDCLGYKNKLVVDMDVSLDVPSPPEEMETYFEFED